MTRYRLKLLVRQDPDKLGEEDCRREEWEVKHHVTTPNEESARRSALERAHSQGLLVTRFTKIEVRCI